MTTAFKRGRLLIGFYWGKKPLTILESASWTIILMETLNKELHLFDELFITGSKSKIYHNTISRDENISNLANAILKNKAPAIKKYHKGIMPSVNFREEVG
jgi:hypothetical protein